MTEQIETQETTVEVDVAVEGSVAQVGAGGYVPSDQPASLAPFDPSSGAVTHDSQGGNAHAGVDPSVGTIPEPEPVQDEVAVSTEVVDTEGQSTETPEQPVQDEAADIIELLGSTANPETTVDGAVEAGLEAETGLTDAEIEGIPAEIEDEGGVLVDTELQADADEVSE